MKKLYVKEFITVNSDGEEIVTIKTYESMPRWFSYLIWI